MRAQHWAVAVAGFATLALAGGDARATIPDKSGNSPAEALTIRLVNENSNPGAEGAALDEFVRLVDELSSGTMKVEVSRTGRLPSEVWDSQRGPDAHTRAVIEGKADLGFIGNNYWGLEGVTTTQAAQAPLLIRSTAQAVKVSDDARLVDDMFAGLKDVGVVGLAMVPQNFKVLVSFDGPVATPADLTGKVLQSRAAPELFSFFEALGTKPQQDGVGRQLYVAPPWIEADWNKGVAVGNLPVYFVYFDIVANGAFWTGLTDDQRGVLSEAAAQAQDLAVANLPEAESATHLGAYCDRGGTVSHLDDASIVAFEAVAKPTIDGLKSAPAVADLLARIAALGEDTEPTVYAECGEVPATSAAAGVPDGTYRFEVTDEDLRRVAIPQDDWSYDVGVYTVTMKGGDYSWIQQSPGAPDLAADKGAFEGGGTYEVNDTELAMKETALGAVVTTTLTWTVGDDGSLNFKIVERSRDFPLFFFGEPWIRIGDA